MQAYWMRTGAEGAMLELRETAVPQAGPGQLLVRLQAASLNRGEFLVAPGAPEASGWKQAGGEGSGLVVSAGAEVSRFKPGDRVMGRCAGAFAEYALMEEAETLAVPDSLSPDEADSLMLTFLVAYDMLVIQGRLRPGEWLLVNGVSSGVGVASLQMAKLLGAKVIGTSGSADKLALLQGLGLDAAIHSRAPDFAAAVLEATAQHGADLVVNTVGGSVFAENIRAMAFEGRLATVGHVDGVLHAELDLEALHRRRLTLFGVSNKLRSKAQRAAALPAFEADFMPHVAAGRLRPQIDRIFDFEHLAQAKARMEGGAHVGKIVLRMA